MTYGPPTNPTQAIADAQTKCDPGKTGTAIADEGRTLTVDGKGTDDLLSGRGLESAGLVCLMDSLTIPQAVREHVSQTRALDGRQTDTWEGFTASWSYHPDSGINLIVQAV